VLVEGVAGRSCRGRIDLLDDLRHFGISGRKGQCGGGHGLGFRKSRLFKIQRSKVLEGDQVVGDRPVDELELLDGAIGLPLFAQKLPVGNAGGQIVGIVFLPVLQKLEGLFFPAGLNVGLG